MRTQSEHQEYLRTVRQDYATRDVQTDDLSPVLLLCGAAVLVGGVVVAVYMAGLLLAWAAQFLGGFAR